jgi:hypothetical protein
MGNDAYFARDWLALREPVDHRSRAHDLAAQTRRYLRRRAGRPAVIVDLGAGRGSNLRYLQARLDAPAQWRLLDHDPDILATLAASGSTPGTIATEVRDLAEPLGPVLAGADLVTAAALLDLASAVWIEAFCEACSAAGAAVLIALSIDGRVRFSNPDSQDEFVLAEVAHDQRRDKGLGPALAGSATTHLVNALAAHGYAITTQASDWHLDETNAALACALIDGWREAVQRRRSQASEIIASWAKRRKTTVTAGNAQLTVGHIDVLGLPPYTSS